MPRSTSHTPAGHSSVRSASQASSPRSSSHGEGEEEEVDSPNTPEKLADQLLHLIWCLAFLAIGFTGSAEDHCVLNYPGSTELCEQVKEWIEHWLTLLYDESWLEYAHGTQGAEELWSDLHARRRTIAGLLDRGDMLQVAAFKEIMSIRWQALRAAVGHELPTPATVDPAQAELRWNSTTLQHYARAHLPRSPHVALHAHSPAFVSILSLANSNMHLVEDYNTWYKHWTHPQVLARLNRYNALEWIGLDECLRRIKSYLTDAQHYGQLNLERSYLAQWTPRAVDQVLRPVPTHFVHELSLDPTRLTETWPAPPARILPAQQHALDPDNGFWAGTLEEWDEEEWMVEQLERDLKVKLNQHQVGPASLRQALVAHNPLGYTGAPTESDLLSHRAAAELYEEVREWLGHWRTILQNTVWLRYMAGTSSAEALYIDLKTRRATIAASLDAGELLQMAAYKEIGLAEFANPYDHALAEQRWNGTTLQRFAATHSHRPPDSYLTRYSDPLVGIYELANLNMALVADYQQWYQHWTHPKALAKVNRYRTLEWDGVHECLHRIKSYLQEAQQRQRPELEQLCLHIWTPAAVETVLSPAATLFANQLSSDAERLTETWPPPPPAHLPIRQQAQDSTRQFWANQLQAWDEDGKRMEELKQSFQAKMAVYTAATSTQERALLGQNPLGW
ncbi:hypothetical protein JCM10908_001319 [Rhodotorula pacifica]|uniref:uncharacterized protein n=1 Tax=Rhodotorula pacifica TaxID=1495444 RepID=UPI0031774B1B